LNQAIEEITVTRTSAEWVDLLLEHGVPCGPIHAIDEMFEDPQVRHLGIAEAIDTEPFGATRMMAQPVRLQRTPSRLAAAPPGRGEHADELLQELGLSGDEIRDLKERAIV
jgi:formyl-CoA transferase